jgi:hypothetical protein
MQVFANVKDLDLLTAGSGAVPAGAGAAAALSVLHK